MELSENFRLPDFWQRPFALIIDLVLLSLTCQVVAMFMPNFLAQHIVLAHLIGILVGVVYFAVMDSGVTQGMTVGKMLMRIRTVNARGEYLPIWQAGVRSVPVLLPVILYGAPFPRDLILSWGGPLISMMLYGLLVNQVLMYWFEKKQRRMLHDRWCNTVVIREDDHAPQFEEMSNYLRAVMIGVVVVSLTLPFLLPMLFVEKRLDRFDRLYNSLDQRPDILTLQIRQGIVGRDSTDYVLDIRLKVSEKPEDMPAFIDELGTLIKRDYPEVAKLAGVHLGIKYGFDMGLTATYSSESTRFVP